MKKLKSWFQQLIESFQLYFNVPKFTAGVFIIFLILLSLGYVAFSFFSEYQKTRTEVNAHKKNYVYDQTNSIMALLSVAISNVRDADEDIFKYCHPELYGKQTIQNSNINTIAKDLKAKLKTMVNLARQAYNLNEITHEQYATIIPFALWNNKLLSNVKNVCFLQNCSPENLEEIEDSIDCKVYKACEYPILTEKEKLKTCSYDKEVQS